MFDAVVAADTVVINKSNQLLSSRSSQESTCNDRSCHKAGGDFLQGVRLPRFMPKEGERPCKDCCLFCARLASIPIRIAQLGQGFGGGAASCRSTLMGVSGPQGLGRREDSTRFHLCSIGASGALGMLSPKFITMDRVVGD